MAAGCDWLAVGWKFKAAAGHHAAKYIVTYSEAEDTVWRGPPPSTPPMEVAAQQVKIVGLRAGVDYEVRVAVITAKGHQSDWATLPGLRTTIATQVPESPEAPHVRDDGRCHRIVRLQLPAPLPGCRSPTSATLQYSTVGQTAQGSGSGSSWADHNSPVTSTDVELYDLAPNASYRFRLIAHNAAGSSRPGRGTDPVLVCDDVAYGGAHAGSPWEGVWLVASAPDPTSAFLIVLLIAVCVASVGVRRCCTRTPCGLGRGARYERASTKAPEELEFAGGDEAVIDGAYDEFAHTLCVHVYVPASSKPIQIDMSTVGLDSTSLLIHQLRIVVSEVAGRDPPLTTEELSVVFEDGNTGVQEIVHPGIDLDEVFAASRVVASIAQKTGPLGAPMAARNCCSTRL